MHARIVLLPGDGIGPEVVAAARQILEMIAARSGRRFEMEERLIGGCAIDATGSPLPEDSLQACQQADAVLLGAVGGPKWDDPNAAVRPEGGLLAVRKALGLFANLRPVRPHPALAGASPLKRERLEGVDLLVVRELTSGLYFGQPKKRYLQDGEPAAVDTLTYTRSEIERVARAAFELARGRRRKVSSIDKANVLETSRLWRQTVVEVSKDYPDITLEHVLVDAAAMFLVTRPATFDVLLTENTFGDILSDEASVLSGSLGALPSASLGEGRNRLGQPRGLYEPIHGSAPDIAGKGIANPTGTLLSAAMLLRHSLGLAEEAAALEAAVDGAIADGCRTADIARPGEQAMGTQAFAQEVIARISS
jgi:3-isopropylmalate dehydrogenase